MQIGKSTSILQRKLRDRQLKIIIQIFLAECDYEYILPNFF